MSETKAPSFLIAEAQKLVDKAMIDEDAYKLLNVYFEGYKNQNNWKYPTQTNFQDFTGIFSALEGMYSRVIHTIAAYLFFTGGVEVEVKSISHIIVSTKGYYHYIGA